MGKEKIAEQKLLWHVFTSTHDTNNAWLTHFLHIVELRWSKCMAEHTSLNLQETHSTRTGTRLSTHGCCCHRSWPTCGHKDTSSTPRWISVLAQTAWISRVGSSDASALHGRNSDDHLIPRIRALYIHIIHTKYQQLSNHCILLLSHVKNVPMLSGTDTVPARLHIRRHLSDQCRELVLAFIMRIVLHSWIRPRISVMGVTIEMNFESYKDGNLNISRLAPALLYNYMG